MVIELGPELESALNESARRQGITADVLAIRILRERFPASDASLASRDDWEAMVLGLGTDCGVSLSDSALSSEGLYE